MQLPVSGNDVTSIIIMGIRDQTIKEYGYLKKKLKEYGMVSPFVSLANVLNESFKLSGASSC